MTAQPTEVRQIVTITCLAAAESPLQRQILLWQQELLRRASRVPGNRGIREHQQHHR
jgi:hypothetical protein